jgi:hypothetical protein
MRTTKNTLCVCGHTKEHHELWSRRWRDCTWNTMTSECYCMEFKIDNLAYIEQKAKKKKLI